MHIFTKWSKHISWKIELIWFESSSNEQLHVNIKYDSHCQEVTSSYWLKKEIIFFFYREKTQSFSFLLFLNICLICKHTASTITFSKTIHCISCKKKVVKNQNLYVFFDSVWSISSLAYRNFMAGFFRSFLLRLWPNLSPVSTVDKLCDNGEFTNE